MINVYDCTPAMGDVVSGNVARPRERRKRGESAGAWLKQTPAWRKFTELRPDLLIQNGLPMMPMLATKITPPDYLATPIAFTLPNANIIITVNEDGTRLAVIDVTAELERLWQSEARRRMGRPLVENPSPRTLAVRRHREKRKQ